VPSREKGREHFLFSSFLSRGGGGTRRRESQPHAPLLKPDKQKAGGGRSGERQMRVAHTKEMGRRASGVAHVGEKEIGQSRTSRRLIVEQGHRRGWVG
jgi:hypothetical protein